MESLNKAQHSGLLMKPEGWEQYQKAVNAILQGGGGVKMRFYD